MEDPLNLYMQIALGNSHENMGFPYTDFIPHSYYDTYTRAEKKLATSSHSNQDLEMREIIADIFRSTTKKYGVWTDQAKNNLTKYIETGGMVEIGHQPKFLGGERFLLNKLACGGRIQFYSPHLVPFLYIADYDKIHGELIKTRIPILNSSTGLSLSIDKDIEQEYNEDSINCLPKPTESYLTETLNEIRRTYQFSTREAIKDAHHAQMYEERLEQALQLIRLAYFSAEDYAEWFGRIVGSLTNIVENYGMLFIRASNPQFQQLVLPYYESLLENRTKYVRYYIDLYDKFDAYGYNPPLREVKRDFVPFFVECPQNHCNDRRVLLSAEESNGKILLKGTCEACHNEIEIETSASHPDLSDWCHNLTPRVDSRQFLVSSTIKPQIHIAGTGETRYYMMDLPLLKQFDPQITLPLIYFYNKVTFNTPMTRYLEEPLKEIPDYFPALKLLMKNVGKYKKLAKKSFTEETLDDRIHKCTALLQENEHNFNSLQAICMDTLQQSKASQEILQNALPAYLANYFGKINEEKSGQETVFHWIDLAVKNGLQNLFSDYHLIYQPWQSPGFKVQL